MPRRFTRKRRSFRRRGSRNFKRRNRSVRRRKSGSVSTRKQPGLVAADRQLVKLRYVDTDTPVLSATGLLFKANTYKINSPYDVNNSVGSTAMPGFNEWATLYTRYRVGFCKVTARFVNPCTFPIYCGLYFNASSTPGLTTWDAYRELQSQPFNRTKLCGPVGSNNMVNLKIAYPIWKLLGNKQQYNSDTSYQSVTGTNPIIIYYCNTYVLSPDGITNITASVTVQCEVTMYCALFNRAVIYS